MTIEDFVSLAREKGLTVTMGPASRIGITQPEPNPVKPHEKKPKPKVVREEFHDHLSEATWVLPIITASEANGRDWKSRSRRTIDARAIVFKAFAMRMNRLVDPARMFHKGYGLRVKLTRLGGAKLDKTNLPHALKATEDAVAMYLGANDGADNWLIEHHQEPGGPYGVRIQISIEDRT